MSATWEVAGWRSDAAGEPEFQTLVVRMPRSDSALLDAGYAVIAQAFLDVIQP